MGVHVGVGLVAAQWSKTDTYLLNSHVHNRNQDKSCREPPVIPPRTGGQVIHENARFLREESLEIRNYGLGMVGKLAKALDNSLVLPQSELLKRNLRGYRAIHLDDLLKHGEHLAAFCVFVIHERAVRQTSHPPTKDTNDHREFLMLIEPVHLVDGKQVTVLWVG